MNRLRAPGYDLFKLAVTIVLAVILLLMLLRGCASTPAAPSPVENTSVSEPTQNVVPPARTELQLPTETPENDTPSAPASATATVTPTLQPEIETPTPTAEAATLAPEATATTPAGTGEAGAPPTGAETSSCNTISPSRLSVGQNARVAQRLNMRAAPAITAPILQVNSTNTQVEVIGGPVCQPVGEGAYLWWQIRLANGEEGWSAETPLNEASYLLEPLP